jgi:hypothetical protein
MGCSHSARNPENFRTGAQRRQGEIMKYKNFNYSESKNSESSTGPALHMAGPALPDSTFMQRNSNQSFRNGSKKNTNGKKHNYL